MQFDEYSNAHGPLIDSYQAGEIGVANTQYRQAIFLDEQQATPLNLSSAADLSLTDVQAALDADADTRPELILIGTGAHAQMIQPRLYATLGQHGIGVEVMNTGAACRTFNVLRGEGRRVWAWLWPL